MEKNNINIKNIIKGLAISIIFTIISLFIFSLILINTNISEKTMPPVIIVITIIGIFIGSTFGNLKLHKNGMLNGAIIGGAYLIALYTCSSMITGNFSVNLPMIIVICLGIIFGAIGGVIGVNHK